MEREKWEDFFKDKAKVAALRLICLASFKAYIKTVFFAINGKKFTFKPFHETIIQKLQDIADGKNTKKNLLLNIPVGSGKSLIVEMFITWCFARDISCKFCYVSHSADLIAKLSNETKEIICSDEWYALFKQELKRSERAKLEYSFEGAGSRSGLTGASIGGAITGVDAGNPNAQGFGGGLIIDDPMDVGDANSETAKAETVRLYTDKLSTRLRSQNTPIILIMQRIGVDDLAAYVMKNEPDEWDVVKISALYKDDKNTWQSIWPEKYPVNKLLRMEQVNPTLFWSQYMQEPRVAGGNLFKDTMFVRGPMPSHYDYTFITCDTASTSKTSSDYTVAAFWGVSIDEKGGKRLYLLDILRDKIDSAQCEDYLIPFIKKHAHQNFVGSLIEPKGHGIYLNQRMPQYNVPMQNPDFVDEFFKDRRLDKVARANIIIPQLVANPILAGDGVNDYVFDDCKSELLAFPDGAHDDFCLDGNTLIATIRGDKPIKDIQIGDKLITPLGISEVTKCGITGYKETIKKFGIEATKDHKVFTGKSFDKLEDILYDVLLDTLTYKGLIKWQYKKLLYLMEKNTVLWGRESIISINAQQIKDDSVLKDFILRCGSIIAERKFRKVMLFITKMVTYLTTITEIWSVYQGKNTLRYTQKTLVNALKPRKLLNILLKFVNLQKNGTQVKKGENGTAKHLRELWNSKDKSLFVPIVEDNLKSVLPIKQISTEKNSVSYAMINTVSEKDVQEKKPVYNITTKAGCYYANGILVSNCDTLIDAVKFTYNRDVSILDVL